MFCLPSPFEGGDLVVRHKGHEVIFDWASQVIDPETQKHRVAWGFLYSDVEHEVLPVTSGTRLTLAFDVYAINQTAKIQATVRANPILDGLSKLFDPANNFCPKGGSVAIGLEHAYPASAREGFADELSEQLKGEDYTILETIVSLGYTWSIIAVYEVYEYERDDFDELTAFDALLKADAELLAQDWTCSQAVVAPGFFCAEGGQWEGDDRGLVMENGAGPRHDYIWLSPTKKFEYTNNWVSYGNGVSSGLDRLIVHADTRRLSWKPPM
jgi:hypothetical protein